MSPSADAGNLEFRVGLLERSLADAKLRIGELTQALAATAKLPSQGEVPTPQPIVVDADSVAPFVAGFYRREEDNEGRAFRWTGRADFFEFRFALDRNIEWTYALEVRPNIHVDVAMLRAFVDYAEMPFQLEAGGRQVRGTLPVRNLSATAVLTFYLPGKFVPSEKDAASKDMRALGLIFYRMTLEPTAAAAEPPSEDVLAAVNG